MIKIALAGNQNSGKTTLFNALTGMNQFVGNWPGVTVEKKEGKVNGYNDVILTDLPGIYSLSPYTQEEVISRNYLVKERPDVILNIVDGTNIERNLYLTTQLREIGIPVLIAINMIDLVEKRGDKIDVEGLSKALETDVVKISALKGTGIKEAIAKAVQLANDKSYVPHHIFSGVTEHAIAHIEECCLHSMDERLQRWYGVKLFERDKIVQKDLNISQDLIDHIEIDIKNAEKELGDDAESIITNERYDYIEKVLKGCYVKKSLSIATTSAKIDKVVTSKYFGLPIFVLIIFLIYYISVSTVGTLANGWVNDGVFGEGWHLFGIGTKDYATASDEYGDTDAVVETYLSKLDNGEEYTLKFDKESESFSPTAASTAIRDLKMRTEEVGDISVDVLDEETGLTSTFVASPNDVRVALDNYEKYDYAAPDPASYGVWIPSIPVLFTRGLKAIHCADWLVALVVDGIVGGVGAVLGFIPQITVLFLLLAFLEISGYMARIAFILDRLFKRFGLSGKSFISMLIGTGCGVPGIMSSRTIENVRDRRMTIITTTFMPCSAKLPIIALVAGYFFKGSWWVAPSSYFLGMASIIVSGIILKKTKQFAGESSPFVMELPDYHMPTLSAIWHSVWERVSSFVKKAGTIILLSSLAIWILSHFGVQNGRFLFSLDMELDYSIIGYIAKCLSWIFIPLGFGNIRATIACFLGLVAKEEIVGVIESLGGVGLFDISVAASYAFLVFNLLNAPCFAAIGAIKREMNSPKWTWFAVCYQVTFAYLVSFMIYQISTFFSLLATSAAVGAGNVIGFILALVVLGVFVWALLRKNKYSSIKLATDVAV